jgi:vancomycin permeability regulator SanA
MRALLRFLSQCLAAILVVLVFTVIWIIFDGLTDLGDRADTALVFSDPGSSKADTEARLKHVVELHKDGDFTKVIVSGPVNRTAEDKPSAMAKYLSDHGIPADTITEVNWTENGPQTAQHIAATMKAHNMSSVMLVTDYYHITLTKLQLYHAGVTNIEKGHIGSLQKDDAWKIANEVVVLYGFIAQTYVLPAASKVKDEAKVGAEKASQDASAAKDTVSNGLNSLSK